MMTIDTVIDAVDMASKKERNN